jgi:hypothetical protein
MPHAIRGSRLPASRQALAGSCPPDPGGSLCKFYTRSTRHSHSWIHQAERMSPLGFLLRVVFSLIGFAGIVLALAWFQNWIERKD